MHEIVHEPFKIAQVAVDPIPSGAAIVFSGPQFLIALLAGVVMAFGFQLLLTTLSVASAISPAGSDAATDSVESDSLGRTIRKVENRVGLWALSTVSIALFFACFLAVKLSLVSSVLLGAIIGVVIWSTFFSLMLWISSTTVGSVIGSLLDTVTSGVRGMMGTASAAIGMNVAKTQAVSTAEDIAAAVRNELTSGITPESIRETLKSTVSGIKLPTPNLEEIGKQFERILKNSDLKDITDSNLLRNVNRDTFVNLISDRTDFSKEEIDRVADRLEQVWRRSQQSPQTVQNDLLELFRSGDAQELLSNQVLDRLDQLVSSASGQNQKGSPLTNLALGFGLDSLRRIIQGNVDLSDVDVEKITDQLQKLTNRVGEPFKQGSDAVSKILTPAQNTIRADVEHYILDSLSWHLNRLTLQNEFRDVIYDPNADMNQVKQQLAKLDRSTFVDLMTQRGDLNEAQIEENANLMETLRQEVLEQVSQSADQQQAEGLRSRLEDFLRSTSKEDLSNADLSQSVSSLLEDPEAGIEELQSRFGHFDRDALLKVLTERGDVNDEEANQILSQVEQVRDRVLNSAQEVQNQATERASELRHRVEDYLRNTNKEELNPEAIEHEIRTLFDDPQAGLSMLRSRLSQFDRDTLVQLLNQRQDLNEEQINQILDRIESVRDRILQAPQQLAGQAKEQYDQTVSRLTEYLRNTNLEELNPEGIRRDLETLFSDPETGASLLRSRLSQVDRDTLVKLLSQREDLSEEQINQTIDQVQEAIRSIAKVPQRYVSRVQRKVQDFGGSLESYLQNTNKEELNPEAIKRDLQLLLNDPRAGASNLTDRLSQIDRDTVVALLSQREDISEEEANQVIDQVLSVRDQFVEQIKQLQQRFQSVLDRVFEQTRSYLNSLDRPELNYDSIKHDISTLFDDPKSGVEALRDRLSQFDRETLVALLSSRKDISEADANRIIDQIESARDSVLQRAEYVQQETQRRLEQIKHQTQKQTEAAQRAVASAAWWLFGTALTSLAVSAVAGAIAVMSVDWF
jgi:uncharacterized protein YlzI (FlbEa/FlbD family)